MVDAKTLGGLLFGIHTHAELLLKFDADENAAAGLKNPSEIIYREEDIIALLKILGFPEPEWGKSISLDDFKSKQDERRSNKSGPEISY